MDMHIRIVPPRVRTILIEGKSSGIMKPIRLAFPYLVFQEYPPQAGSNGGQTVFATRERPTWDTALYQFPLAWHPRVNGEYTREIQDYSHINSSGSVCYDSEVVMRIQRGEMTHQDAFWNSVYVKYDTYFVREWAAVTKTDVQQATTMALRFPVALNRDYTLLERCWQNVLYARGQEFIRCPNITTNLFPALTTDLTIITHEERHRLDTIITNLRNIQIRADKCSLSAR